MRWVVKDVAPLKNALKVCNSAWSEFCLDFVEGKGLLIKVVDPPQNFALEYSFSKSFFSETEGSGKFGIDGRAVSKYFGMLSGKAIIEQDETIDAKLHIKGSNKNIGTSLIAVEERPFPNNAIQKHLARKDMCNIEMPASVFKKVIDELKTFSHVAEFDFQQGKICFKSASIVDEFSSQLVESKDVSIKVPSVFKIVMNIEYALQLFKELDEKTKISIYCGDQAPFIVKFGEGAVECVMIIAPRIEQEL